MTTPGFIQRHGRKFVGFIAVAFGIWSLGMVAVLIGVNDAVVVGSVSGSLSLVYGAFVGGNTMIERAHANKPPPPAAP